MDTITRWEAQRRGFTRFYTDKPCKRGHVTERFVANGRCVACQRAQDRAWNAAHREQVRARDRAWYAAHPEQAQAKVRAWNAAHPDHVAAMNGLTDARRRAPGCVPPGFDYRTTVPSYATARRRTRETGVPHEVDHIIPLCWGVARGGWHRASNLQVIPATANRVKANAERANPPRQRRQ